VPNEYGTQGSVPEWGEARDGSILRAANGRGSCPAEFRRRALQWTRAAQPAPGGWGFRSGMRDRTQVLRRAKTPQVRTGDELRRVRSVVRGTSAHGCEDLIPRKNDLPSCQGNLFTSRDYSASRTMQNRAGGVERTIWAAGGKALGRRPSQGLSGPPVSFLRVCGPC